MTYREAFKRAGATFAFAVSTSLAGASLVGVEVWKAAVLAGAGAVVNYVVRVSQAYLASVEVRPNG